MNEKELDLWWSTLAVKEQERIASKVAKETITYPTTTRVWLNLTIEAKLRIYKHCVAKHDDEEKEWQEGQSMSY